MSQSRELQVATGVVSMAAVRMWWLRSQSLIPGVGVAFGVVGGFDAAAQ